MMLGRMTLGRLMLCQMTLGRMTLGQMTNTMVALYLQSKKKDSNQEAREFFGLLDLYTSIQQEILAE